MPIAVHDEAFVKTGTTKSLSRLIGLVKEFHIIRDVDVILPPAVVETPEAQE
ncbi:hypothetical protein KIPB_010585, partial [Kipferlia bialata]|eukprot:g10585.t1